MKQVKGFFLITILACSAVFGQNRTFGIKGGFTISNLWGYGTENMNNQLRRVAPSLDEQNLYWFAAGIFCTRELLPDLFSIQSELLYLRGGKNWEGNIGGTGFSSDIHVDYLQMPWLVKITIPVALRPRVYFGPHINWMFRSRLKDLPPSLEQVLTGTGALETGGFFERYTNNIDLGLTTGVDFDIPFGIGNLVFDFRYNLGALNVLNVPAAAGVRNYVFLFMAGYSMDFGY